MLGSLAPGLRWNQGSDWVSSSIPGSPLPGLFCQQQCCLLALCLVLLLIINCQWPLSATRVQGEDGDQGCLKGLVLLGSAPGSRTLSNPHLFPGLTAVQPQTGGGVCVLQSAGDRAGNLGTLPTSGSAWTGCASRDYKACLTHI